MHLLALSISVNWAIMVTRLYFSIFITFYCTSLFGQSPSFTRSPLPPDTQGSRGVSLTDLNGDNFLDLVVANQLSEIKPEGNPVYYNLKGKGFKKVLVGLEEGRYWSEAVHAIDVDNDTDIDLFFASQFNAINPLYLNDGTGKFTLSNAGDLSNDSTNSPGACWCDFDDDGDLDVFVVNRDGLDDNLYINEGKGFFTRATAGPWKNNGGDGRSCAWGDLDGDGLPDLYVVNFVVKQNGEVTDAHRNYLYLNKGKGVFQELHEGVHVEEKNASYGVSFVDYDYDGDIDIYVTNVSSRYGNAFYRNEGKGIFKKLGELEIGDFTNRPSKGQTWGDFNNDGYLDVYIANGTEGYPEIQNYLYMGTAQHTFNREYVALPAIDPHISAGASSGDIDNDGDLDIYVCNWGKDGEANDLYVNEAHDTHWVKFRLRGTKSNSQGIGSWVTIETLNGVQTRYHYLHTGYGSQNAPDVHFGLAVNDRIKSVGIKWPSGIIQSFEDVRSNTTYLITEEQGIKPIKK